MPASPVSAAQRDMTSLLAMAMSHPWPLCRHRRRRGGPQFPSPKRFATLQADAGRTVRRRGAADRRHPQRLASVIVPDDAATDLTRSADV